MEGARHRAEGGKPRRFRSAIEQCNERANERETDEQERESHCHHTPLRACELKLGEPAGWGASEVLCVQKSRSSLFLAFFFHTGSFSNATLSILKWSSKSASER